MNASEQITVLTAKLRRESEVAEKLRADIRELETLVVVLSNDAQRSEAARRTLMAESEQRIERAQADAKRQIETARASAEQRASDVARAAQEAVAAERLASAARLSKLRHRLTRRAVRGRKA